MHAGQENNYKNSEEIEDGASYLRGEDFLIYRVKERNVRRLKAVLEISKSATNANEEGKEARLWLDVVPFKVSLTHGD